MIISTGRRSSLINSLKKIEGYTAISVEIVVSSFHFCCIYQQISIQEASLSSRYI